MCDLLDSVLELLVMAVLCHSRVLETADVKIYKEGNSAAYVSQTHIMQCKGTWLLLNVAFRHQQAQYNALEIKKRNTLTVKQSGPKP